MRRLPPQVVARMHHVASEIETTARSRAFTGHFSRWTFTGDDLLHVLEKHGLTVVELDRRSLAPKVPS